jgi:hypothetical protein
MHAVCRVFADNQVKEVMPEDEAVAAVVLFSTLVFSAQRARRGGGK